MRGACVFFLTCTLYSFSTRAKRTRVSHELWVLLWKFILLFVKVIYCEAVSILYCTLLQGIGVENGATTVLFLFSWFERTRGPDFSFKMLLDRGLRANYHIYLSNTELLLSGKHCWPKVVCLSYINENFKATPGENSVNSTTLKRGRV